MKILHVMSEFPCPPDSGVRADIWNRIRAMARLGYSIDLVAMQAKQPPDPRHWAELRRLVNTMRFVPRQPLRKCLATVRPTAVARNRSLAELPLNEFYDVTLAEGDNSFPIFANPRLQTTLRVLRVHNNESAYNWAAARTEESFLGRQFHRLEALRFTAFSWFAYRRVHSLWFISQSEYQSFVVTEPAAAAQAVWLPPAIEFGPPPPRRPLHCRQVLFVASFHISLNREGLRWYLRQVHPCLAADSQYELVVAGSTSGGGSRGQLAAQLFAEHLKREKRCQVHVDVEDLTALYRDCALVINPVQRGAGVKVKNVHAIERGLPVVTTSVGNEGSGFRDREHVRIADTPADFAATITELLNDYDQREQMAARAYSYLRRHYDCQANINRLVTASRAGPHPFGRGAGDPLVVSHAADSNRPG